MNESSLPTRNAVHDCSRYGVCVGRAEQQIGFFLVDTFAMLPFVSAVEPLRACQRPR